MRRAVVLLWCLCILAAACSSSTNIDISDSFTPRPTPTPRIETTDDSTSDDDGSGNEDGSGDEDTASEDTTGDDDAAAAWDEDTQPGAAGFGDSYFPTLGNGGYDVAHYTIRLSWNQAERHLDGQAEITAVAVEDLTSFHLDLAGLTVSSVVVDGADAHFEQDGDELIVLPEAPLDEGDGFVVLIGYGGEPTALPPIAGVPVSGWMTTADSAYVVSEPAGTATWFPVNDHPADKATYRFEVTVPEGIEVAANGLLVDSVTNGGTTTWVYDAPDPQAPYLTTVVIGDLELIDAGKVDVGNVDGGNVDGGNVDGGNGEPVIVRHAIATSIAAEISDFDATPRMIEVLSEMFGPYPFVAYGVVVVDDSFGAALETQTMSIFGRDFVLGGANIELVAVHELAHQWFGNAVSLDRWQDIWLNEGFASYAELLWLEATDPAFDIDAAAEARRQRSQPGVPVGDPGPDLLFSSAVYQGGAATLHALRRTVGDPAFFAVLQEWVSRYGGGNATTEDFVALSEEISGQDLSEFFDAWLDSTELPPLPQ